MEISNLYNKFRYLSNTKSLQSLLFTSSQSVSSFSSSKTLIPIINPSSDFSATKNPNTNFNNNGNDKNDSDSHLIFRNPSLVNPPLKYSFSSDFSATKNPNTNFNNNANGYVDSHLIFRNPSLNRSISSFRLVSISSFTTFTSSQGRTTHGNIFFRSFSILNKSSPTGTFVSRGKSDFGELSRVVVDDDKLQTSKSDIKRKIGYVKPPVLLSETEKEKIAKIVELVKKGEHDMEAELDQIDLNLTHALVREIFRLLNSDGVSGLHFFGWVSETKIDFSRNSDFCSLIIDNLGRLEDFETMLLMLKDFSKKGLCITENAFSFLRVCSTDGSVGMSSVKHVIDTLKKAGGSSRGSGIHALIKKLCTLNSFDLAVYVMEETTMKTSYYNVLIWAKCGSTKFQEAQELFDEMRRFGCNPNANSYNYILGSLCKNGRITEACNLLEVMDKSGYLPDAITFEVIIHHAAKLGRLDFAFEFLDQMMSRGIEPRLTTHAAFIKGFFNCDRFQEAYKYVVDMAVKYKCSGNMNYSLLANLHRQEGKLIEAREILVDMIEKGLKPNFSVYIKVMKDLHKSGMGPLVGDLKSRFSKFNSSAQVQ